MAIVSGPCNQYILNAFLGSYNHTAGSGNAFKYQLLLAAANRSPDDTVMSATGEHAATGGYVTGGAVCAIVTPVLHGSPTGIERKVLFDIADASWIGVTLSGVRGGQIYNTTVSNHAWMNQDFGGTIGVAGGDLNVTQPPPVLATAVMRI